MNPAPPGDRAPFTGRAAYSITQVYYYAAAVVGVGFVIGGAIATLLALRRLILPKRLPGFAVDTTRGSVHGMLVGLAFLIPGLVCAWWHLKQAHEHEGRFHRGAFWGKALYFHLVAFISIVTVMGGAAAALANLADVALPDCITFPTPVPLGPPGGATPPGFVKSSCDQRGDAARGVADGLIVVLVAGAVFYWHIKQARKEDEGDRVGAAGPPPGEPPPSATTIAQPPPAAG